MPISTRAPTWGATEKYNLTVKQITHVLKDEPSANQMTFEELPKKLPGLIPAQMVKSDIQRVGKANERGDPSVPAPLQVLNRADRDTGQPGQRRNGQIFRGSYFLKFHSSLLKQITKQCSQQKEWEHGEQDADCEAEGLF
jgi:hypothetical protein